MKLLLILALALSNYYGQLGLGDKIDRNIPTKINLPDNIKIKFITCSSGSSYIIDINDELWSFGNNKYGGLGLGGILNRNRNIPTKLINFKVKTVSSHGGHCLFIDMENILWSFGNNNNGQLGLGHFINKNIPTRVYIPDNMPVKDVYAGTYHNFIILK